MKIILKITLFCILIQTLAAQSRSVLPGHPRMILNSTIADTWQPGTSRLQAVKSRVKGVAAADFASLRDVLDNTIKGRFTDYSENGGMLAVAGYAFAYLMLKDSDPVNANRYAATVINGGLLASVWHTEVNDDSEPLLAEAYALAYDWCYDWIVANGKKAAAIAKLKQAYAAHANDSLTWRESIRESDFHNYAAGFLAEFTAIGLALYGDDAAAPGMLDRGWGMYAEGWRMDPTGFGEPILYKLKDSIDLLSGGAMNWEGPVYWRNAVPELLRGIEEYDTATGRSRSVWTSLFGKTINAAWYKIYCRRPDGKQPAFGDSTEGNLAVGRDNFAMVILLDRFRTNSAAPYIKKYIPEVTGGAWNAGQGGNLGLLWKMIFWDYSGVITPAPSYAALPLSRDFGQDIIMRSGWGATDTYITANFNWGGIHHRGLDSGSFSIFKGVQLTSRPPYTTSSGDYFYQYLHRSVSANTLLVYDPADCIRDTSKTCGFSAGGTRLTNDGGQRWSVYRRFGPPFTTTEFGINRLWSGSILHDPSLATLDYVSQMKMATPVLKTDSTYDYINADLTGAYTNKWSGLGDNAANRVALARRQMVYARPDYLIIFDRVTSTSSSLDKSWVLHTFGAPNINTGSWTAAHPGISTYTAKNVRADNGTARLFVTNLLPKSAQVRVVGGNSCVPIKVLSATATSPAVFTTDVSHGLLEGEWAAFQNISTSDPGRWGSSYGIATDYVGTTTVHPTGSRTFTLTDAGGRPINGTGVSPYPNATKFPAGVQLKYHSGCGWEGWVDNQGGRGRNLWHPANLSAAYVNSAPRWRIEIGPATQQTQDYFLNVLYTSTTATASAPSSTLIDVAGFYGAQIADPITPKVVLFGKGSLALPTVSYTTSYSGTGTHVITGLLTGNYSVFRNGVAVVANKSVGPDGALSFASASGQFLIAKL